MTPAARLSAGSPAPGRPLKRAARKSVPMMEARTTGGAMPLSRAYVHRASSGTRRCHRPPPSAAREAARVRPRRTPTCSPEMASRWPVPVSRKSSRTSSGRPPRRPSSTAWAARRGAAAGPAPASRRGGAGARTPGPAPTSLLLVDQRGAGKGHDRGDALAGQVLSVVEVGEARRGLQTTLEEQDVAVAEVRSVALADEGRVGSQGDQHPVRENDAVAGGAWQRRDLDPVGGAGLSGVADDLRAEGDVLSRQRTRRGVGGGPTPPEAAQERGRSQEAPERHARRPLGEACAGPVRRRGIPRGRGRPRPTARARSTGAASPSPGPVRGPRLRPRWSGPRATPPSPGAEALQGGPADAGYLHQLIDRLEGAVLLAVLDDGVGPHLPDAGQAISSARPAWLRLVPGGPSVWGDGSSPLTMGR